MNFDLNDPIGVLTAASTVFSMGWGACIVWVGRPQAARIAKLEAKMEAVEKAKDEEIAELRKQVAGLLLR